MKFDKDMMALMKAAKKASRPPNKEIERIRRKTAARAVPKPIAPNAVVDDFETPQEA